MSRILVTGATRGLGRALVNELSRRGHEVVATGRRLEDMADLPAAERLVLDLTNPASIDQALAAAGRLEVVINNAAMTVSGPVEAVPATLVEQVLATNVLGPLRVMQAALPTMRRRGSGRTLNISSPAGRFAPPLEGVYSASKAALEMLSERREPKRREQRVLDRPESRILGLQQRRQDQLHEHRTSLPATPRGSRLASAPRSMASSASRSGYGDHAARGS
jgi:NAD(P)-dependent dehydrogenase (short-subunit alcohol dehydrogenase family)